VRVTARGLVVETWIELEAWGQWIQGLIAYLDDLDASWRGWSGVKEWSDDQRNITLSAARHSTLVATLTVSVKHLPEAADGTGAWDTKVVVPFEPAAISRVAKRVRAELGKAPWEVPALPPKG
jgi:hypothetical protein